MTTVAERLEYAIEGEPQYDFCLWDYEPMMPVGGRLRSVNLLYHSFDVADAGEPSYALVDRMRAALGPSRTVFGVKWIDGRLGWEWYFYDYHRRERTRSISRVVEALAPVTRCDVPVNENLPYFMFSLDITPALAAGEASLDEIHMYVGNVGSAVSYGICYSLTRERTLLENFYFFFDAAQLDEIKGKIGSSAHFDASRFRVEQVLWPELQKCRVIVVANKKMNDALYFVGLDVDQFLFFLKRLRYPESITDFVSANRARLDHMRYDVGLDYRMEQGRLVILKSGYYGVF